MKGKKVGGRDFKPGESGNPNGRPPLPPEVRAIKKLSADELEDMISFLFRANDAEVLKVEADANQPSLQRAIAKAIISARHSGDFSKVDIILNRAIGKTREHLKVEITTPTILKRVNGEEIVFTNQPAKKEIA